MAKDVTYYDYWQEIDSIVKEAMQEPKSRRDQWIHESIDGHQWVIYTYYNLAVLQHSDNSDYGLENGLVTLSSKSSYGELMMALAFWSMVADVRDRSFPMEEEEEEEEE